MPQSRMRVEINEIPVAVERLLTQGWDAIAQAAEAARLRDPAFVVTVGRGSSDHVCTYLKYAAEILMGLPVASVGPSVASIYGARLRLAGSLCLAVSQSGQSPDIVTLVRAAARDGALSVALTNNPSAPMAQAADHVLAIHAGPEHSVAATKTLVTSAVAGMLLLALWQKDEALLAAIRVLPEVLRRAVAVDWGPVKASLVDEASVYCIGRGPGFAMANEAALKFKEVAQIHAESYSSAELMHGPVSIVAPGFPVLALVAGDAAETAAVEVCDKVAATGAEVFVTSDRAVRATRLPFVRAGHPLLDPIALIASFYGLVEAVAVDRGLDPDTPRHLKKVTETL